jgi:DNA-binding PadR family transcriptional regulator
MMTNTLYKFIPFVKFHKDRHFIYITTRRDEHKEELRSYYKLTEEDMEEITKEWPIDLLIPVEWVELSNPDLIKSPMVTREEYGAPNCSRRKKKEEVHELKNASEETTSDSPKGGGDDKVDKEEDKGEEDKKK